MRLDECKIGIFYEIIKVDGTKEAIKRYSIFNIKVGNFIKVDAKGLLGLVLKVSVRSKIGASSFVLRQKDAKLIMVK